MELPEPCCGKYGIVEEELTLTPHHTPSQSFDFIVWEKAYLDSIPAAAAAAGSSCSSHGEGSAASARQGPPTKGDSAEASIRDDDFEERRVPLLHTSSESDAPLMASCRTDADLPSSFFVYKPGISYEGEGATSSSSVTEYVPHRSSSGARLDEGLTSLEEAVRSYAEGRQRRTAPPLPGTYSKRHGMMIKAGTHSSQHDFAAHLVINDNKPAQDHYSSSTYVKSVNNEALLKRSLSQPGGGSIKGWKLRPATSLHAGVDHHVCDIKSSATILKPNSAGHVAGAHPVEFFHDQCNAEAAQRQDGTAKLSCFPISLIGSSPSRQKHSRSSTLDDHEMPDIVGKQYSNRVDIHNQDKLMSSTYKPTLYIHQQQDKLPPSTWADFIDMPVGAASRGDCLAPTMQQHTAGYCRSSFSDISSLSSNDHHAGASAVLLKLKLWGLNHKIKALCRKFCSSCPNFSPSSSMYTDFKR